MTLERKVIQLAVSSGGADAPDVLFVLCDDGSIWRRVDLDNDRRGWTRLPLPTGCDAPEPKT
jgi:hypothetical protein